MFFSYLAERRCFFGLLVNHSFFYPLPNLPFNDHSLSWCLLLVITSFQHFFSHIIPSFNLLILFTLIVRMIIDDIMCLFPPCFLVSFMHKYDWYWYSCWYLLLPLFPFSPHVWSFILFIYFHIRSYSHALLLLILFLVFLSSSAIISVWHKTVASLLPFFDNPRLVVCIIFCWSWQLLDNVSLHFVVGKSNLLWVRHWPSPFLSSPMLFHVRHNFKHFFVPVAETQSRIEFWNSIIPSK